MNKCISISILNVKDINNFLTKIKDIKDGIDKNLKVEDKLDIKIHFDVMDGKFVPNIGVNLEYIKLAKEFGIYADVHLMVKDPIGDGYIDRAIDYGADNITIHQEIENFDSVINHLNNKKSELASNFGRDLSIGVSIKPNTKVKVLENYKDKFDLLLVMSVEPGYGGQKFIKDSAIKVKEAVELYNKRIQIDGGINFETIVEPLRYGCTEFVVGSYITSCDDSEISNKIMELVVLNSFESIGKTSNVEFEKNILQIVPGGYGENDILIGIGAPKTRECARKWYKFLNTNILSEFICSKYHDYRRFAIFCLSNMIKRIKEDKTELEKLIEFADTNIKYINNWDLTDEFGPNVLAYYLLLLDKKEQKEILINKYISSDVLWTKRIGIVSLLTIVKQSPDIEVPLKICDIVLYENYHLYQKATGWVLREIYKKEPKILVEYLYKKNKDKKLPSILLSYACEKMSKQEKEYIRN